MTDCDDKKDAERYRWLKSQGLAARFSIAAIAWAYRSACAFGEDQVDNAIDAAMKEEQQGK